ncbi:MAG: DUF5681 domain-containing protein [Alphaproteobacteria bacterium]
MNGDNQKSAGYEVGYKKPPKSTQFKKGRSGNPSGRPKSRPVSRSPLKYELTSETFKDTFLEEAYRMVNINTGGGEESIPIARAVTRALGVKAAKGHIYAQRLFAQTLIALEAEKRRTSEDLMEGLINYKKKWSEELERRARLNLPLDPPVPHPDDIVVNTLTGSLEVRGPLTPENKEKVEFYKAMLTSWRKARLTYLEDLKSPDMKDDAQFILNELEACDRIIPMLEQLSGQFDHPLSPYETAKANGLLEMFVEDE